MTDPGDSRGSRGIFGTPASNTVLSQICHGLATFQSSKGVEDEDG